jgi:7-cyano-7-deazaguanine synthase
MKRVLVLHSGGLDSTTLLFKAKQDGFDVLSFGVDYRQTHSVEHLFARNQAERLDVPRVVVSVEWSKPDRTIPLGRAPEQIGKDVSKAFLPGRNVIFLSLALAHAAGWGADEVWTGINSRDFSGYPDCTPEFFEAYANMYEIAAPGAARLVAPLIHMTKPEIAGMARSVGLGRGDTWSCYRPKVSRTGVLEPCSECDACVLHAHAWDGLEATTTNG